MTPLESLYLVYIDGTTADTLSFGLWELAKDVELQRRLRQEIRETLRRVQERGGTEIGYDEYDNMLLLVAFMKVSCVTYSSFNCEIYDGFQEVLRFHPAAFTGARQATDDSVIPLLHPIKLESGKIVSEIPVSKGQQIWVNIPGYNR
jgi:cytochrome P450